MKKFHLVHAFPGLKIETGGTRAWYKIKRSETQHNKKARLPKQTSLFSGKPQFLVVSTTTAVAAATAHVTASAATAKAAAHMAAASTTTEAAANMASAAAESTAAGSAATIGTAAVEGTRRYAITTAAVSISAAAVGSASRIAAALTAATCVGPAITVATTSAVAAATPSTSAPAIMAVPAVVIPRAYADEHAAVEPLRPVIAIRSARVGVIGVVAPFTNRRGIVRGRINHLWTDTDLRHVSSIGCISSVRADFNPNCNLGLGHRRERQSHNHCQQNQAHIPHKSSSCCPVLLIWTWIRRLAPSSAPPGSGVSSL
jgi:hypothetical protein